MEPAHRDFLSVLGHLYLSSGKPEKAKAVYEALHVELPEDEAVALSLAWARLRCDEFSGAVEMADVVLRARGRRPASGKDPDFARLVRAKALWRRGDKDEARREMRRFLESAPRREAASLADASPGAQALATRPGTRRGAVQAPTRA